MLPTLAGRCRAGRQGEAAKDRFFAGLTEPESLPIMRVIRRRQGGTSMEFNIQRQGRKWTRSEVEQKYRKLCPEKIELIEGRMFWTDEQRLNMLALLLENVGMDAAVSLGDPALWKQAIDERLKAEEGPRQEGGENAGP